MTKEQRDALYRFVKRQCDTVWENMKYHDGAEGEYYCGMFLAYREVMWILDPQSDRYLDEKMREVAAWTP